MAVGAYAFRRKASKPALFEPTKFFDKAIAEACSRERQSNLDVFTVGVTQMDEVRAPTVYKWSPALLTCNLQVVELGESN